LGGKSHRPLSQARHRPDEQDADVLRQPDLPKALEIFRALRGRINVSFGIGTNLTCDIPGVEPMSIVLKMTACNGQPVAKISDEPGKTHCKDPNFVAYLRHVFQVPALPAYLARSEFMQAVQREIAEQLKVQPPFADEAALKAEVARRITFIQDCLVNSGSRPWCWASVAASIP
jgi:hypothetical protein